MISTTWQSSGLFASSSSSSLKVSVAAFLFGSFPRRIGFSNSLHYKYSALSTMPPKKKKGPGRPPKKKNKTTTTTTPKKKTSTPEPPSSPLTTNEEFEDEHVGKRIEVEYGTGGTKRWYVGTIISSKPHKNLAMVFYEFDKQLGIIDFPKVKRDTRLVPKASRWTASPRRTMPHRRARSD